MNKTTSYLQWFYLTIGSILMFLPANLHAAEKERIVLESSMVRPFAKQGGTLKVDLGLSLHPFGSSTTDYSFACFIDGQETKTYTAADWGQLDYTSRRKIFYLPLPPDISLGEHKLAIAMRRHVDGKKIEDQRLDASFRVYRDTLPRQKFLVEHFTATWCPHCPVTILALEDVNKHCPDVAWVSIHCEDYYAVNGNETFRYINSVRGYPSVYADRRYFEEINSWRIGMAKYNENIPSQEIANEHYPRISNTPIPSLATIQITPQYTAATRTCQIKVDVQTVEEFEKVFGPAALTVVMVEDSIPTLHNNVLRHIISQPQGDAIQWDGKRYSKTYQVKIANNWNPQQIKVVAYVGRQANINDPNDDLAETYVTNTERVPILSQGTTTSISSISHKAITSVERYDAMGRKIVRPMPGLNILRYSDGRVEKHWIKELK
ncbi:MAG: Omp28-related outer membrane protein [Prevotellaceae bacterium]|nr:Omp28-related outer membrane protein [Prevotellaceae bacterium]MDY3365468.1 Omp28-related outer membrane protein [Prevotella sp.]